MNTNRDYKGRFAPKRFLKQTAIFLALFGTVMVLVWFIPRQMTYNALAKTATSTPSTINEDVQALIQTRTEKAMQDPQNLKWYHDQIEAKVTRSINILTSDLPTYLQAQ